MKTKKLLPARCEHALRANIKHMNKPTKNQAKEIRALKRMKDDKIDLTNIPLTRDSSNAVVSKFYRPIKKSLLPWMKDADGGNAGR